uniref:Uncharacterized protein n=1 Tax=Siphoviridae sp. ctF7F8 TaxID=2826211 RepID=A0A8S5MJ92_9CAUD|nr:MAG TPA: hypothetical protein [Siphoviridae sp. ctF7F8]
MKFWIKTEQIVADGVSVREINRSLPLREYRAVCPQEL